MTRLEPAQRIESTKSAYLSETEGAAFRLAMRELASGVSVVTCGEGDQRAGCVVTALASLSLSPPSLLVCLSLEGRTLARLKEVGAFAVNVLGARHERLAVRFSGRDGAYGAARFVDGDWGRGVTGAPVLADALTAIECRVEGVFDHASHAIVIGAVRAIREGDGGPALLHWRSRFATLA